MNGERLYKLINKEICTIIVEVENIDKETYIYKVGFGKSSILDHDGEWKDCSDKKIWTEDSYFYLY